MRRAALVVLCLAPQSVLGSSRPLVPYHIWKEVEPKAGRGLTPYRSTIWADATSIPGGKIPAAPSPTPPPTPRSLPPVTTSSPHESASIRIVSAPPGARVVQDGRLVGETPLLITDEDPGPVRYRVLLDGYQEATISGTAVVGRTTELTVSLRADGQGDLHRVRESLGRRLQRLQR